MGTEYLLCDGCGQPATPEHTVRRLRRLEWATRWRPIHIGTLLLGAHSPEDDGAFLYAGKFGGEGARVLEAVGLRAEGRAAETVLAEFQRGGYFLTHVLECPLEDDEIRRHSVEALLQRRLPAVTARIRRSLKPKRIALISTQLASVASNLSAAQLGCLVVPGDGLAFGLDSSSAAEEAARLREALGVGVATSLG